MVGQGRGAAVSGLPGPAVSIDHGLASTAPEGLAPLLHVVTGAGRQRALDHVAAVRVVVSAGSGRRQQGRYSPLPSVIVLHVQQ